MNEWPKLVTRMVGADGRFWVMRTASRELSTLSSVRCGSLAWRERRRITCRMSAQRNARCSFRHRFEAGKGTEFSRGHAGATDWKGERNSRLPAAYSIRCESCKRTTSSEYSKGSGFGTACCRRTKERAGTTHLAERDGGSIVDLPASGALFVASRSQGRAAGAWPVHPADPNLDQLGQAHGSTQIRVCSKALRYHPEKGR
jgi:hypothetical protein